MEAALMNDISKVEKSCIPFEESKRFDKNHDESLTKADEKYDTEIFDDRQFYSNLLKVL
jgi:hypothetical protein